MPKDRHQVLLLTEDKKDFRKNIRGLLENRGYGFIEAESLQFVMDILKHEDTDLILVDLRLPEMSSTDTLARIRQETPLLWS